MAKKAITWLLFVLTIGLVGCDHATKALARTQLHDRGPVEIVKGVLDLRYSENDDTAFSLLHAFRVHPSMTALALISLAVLAAVAFVWWRKRRDATTPEHVAFALIVAGAAGNVLDRLVRGYVIDFIHLSHWPVFNVADVLIVAGVLLMMFGKKSALLRAPQ